MPRMHAERATLLVVGALACVPFQVWVHQAPLPTFHADFAAGALGLLLVVLAAHVVRGPLRVPVAVLPICGFVAVLGLQALSHRFAYFQQIELGIVNAAWCALLVVAVGRLRGQLGRSPVLAALAWGLAVGGLLAAAIALTQVYDLRGGPFAPVTLHAPGLELTRRAYGNVAQANVLGDYLALGLAAAVHLHVRGRLSTVALLLSGPVLLWVLYLTGSRLAPAYLLAATGVSALWWHRTRATEARRATSAFGAAFLGLFLLDPILRAIGLDPGADAPTRRLGSLVAGDGGLEVRLLLWRHAWASFVSAPILGTGFGSFAQTMFDRASELGRGVPGIDRNAHNLFLHVAAETGIAGLATLAALVGLIVRRLADARADADRAFCATILLVLAIHSLFEFPLWYTNVLGIFAVVVGVLDDRALTQGKRRIPAIGVTAFVALGSLWLTMQWGGWRAAREVIHPTWGTLRGPERVAHAVERVRGTVFEAALDERIALEAPPDDRGLAALVDYVERVRRVMPSPGLVYRQATLLALLGRDDAARAMATNAIAVFPAAAESYARLLDEAVRTDTRLASLAATVNALVARETSARAEKGRGT